MRSILKAAGLALAALALASCSFGPGAVAADEVETLLAEQYEKESGQAPDKVDCPEDLPAEKGAEIECTLTVDETELSLILTATTVEDDTVNFDIEIVE